MAKAEKNASKPNYAVPPGETLRETLQSLGMTQAELAQRSGRPKKTINEIMRGKAAITADTALQLERVLGIPASFWNSLERNYRETLARLKEEEQLQSQIKWLKTFPIASLVRMGWLPKLKSEVQRLQALLNFFGVAGIREWKAIWEGPEAAYRKSRVFQGNPVAVSAWLRKGEIDARKIECMPYKASAFRNALKKMRALTVAPPEVFEPEMKRLCAEAGVAIVFVPELPGTHVYGATRWIRQTKALIYLSLRGKSDDHLWFTFFHETGHILLHEKRDVFIEAKGEGCSEMVGTEKEQEASQFAQDFLIPPKEYEAFLQTDSFGEAAIIQFAEKLGITPGIVVGRLQHDKVIRFSAANSLKKRFRFRQEES